VTVLGLVFVLFGVAVIAVSAGIDLWAGFLGFGPLQIAGVVTGVFLAGLGIALFVPTGRRAIFPGWTIHEEPVVPDQASGDD
jgi:hypothetical protein